MGKRGQVTTFVILGLVLLVILAVVFFGLFQRKQITELEKAKINGIVLECMGESLQRASDYAATQLSQQITTNPSLGMNQEQLRQFLKENIEYDLKENQNTKLIFCFDEKIPGLQPISITHAANIEPTVNLQELDPILIEFDMSFQVTITKGNLQENLERFTIMYEVR
ncbi:hypothetical protein J4430_03165 [Candidatus Woesearchaeota archaeon]|nr:hypothetical protein [Candidatus Woesearchaeota archaeon]